MSERNTTMEGARVTQLLDPRLPLWGILCASATASYFLISMYFTTNQTARDVTELQITVKAGNQQVTTLAGEQALLRFRLENLETDFRALRGTGAHASPSFNGNRP